MWYLPFGCLFQAWDGRQHVFDISFFGCDLLQKGSTVLVWYLPFGCFFQEGRTSFEASGFLIWDIFPFSMFCNAVWVLFPGGANFFWSLWLFNMGYLCFFYVEQWGPQWGQGEGGCWWAAILNKFCFVWGGGIRFLVGWDPKFLQRSTAQRLSFLKNQHLYESDNSKWFKWETVSA